jgi:hypothetical protein
MKDRGFSWLRMVSALMGVMWICGAMSLLAETIELRLDDEEDRKQDTLDRILNAWGSGDEFIFHPGPGDEVVIELREGFGVRSWGSGRVELSIAVQGRGHNDSFLQLLIDGAPQGTLYRKSYNNPDAEGLTLQFEMTIPRGYFDQWSQGGGNFWEHPDFRDYDVVIILRRVVSYCSMLAVVSGDLSGTHHGDMAYFNLFGPGEGVRNELASGNAADDQTHDVLQGMMEMDGGMLEVLEDLGVEVDPESRAAMEAAEKDGAPTELEQWESDMRHSGDNNFGLTLTAVQHAQGSESENYEGDSTDGGLSGFGEAMGALGAFSLGLSGKGSVAESIEDLGDVAVTSLWVAPGARDDNLEAAKFFWEEG